MRIGVDATSGELYVDHDILGQGEPDQQRRLEESDAAVVAEDAISDSKSPLTLL